MRLKKLVIGASGFLGSHVARQLVADGDDVRVMIRKTSSTRGIDDLPVERCYGDIFDTVAVRHAMAGCDVVYYCVVDARTWLRDSTPMWRTNVAGLQRVLDVAAQADLSRFVFTSSMSTIGRVKSGLADENTSHNWLDVAGEYVRTRVAAEKLMLHYCRENALPGVAMCVSNTYGSGDYLPTPHGGMVAAAVQGKMPFYIEGYSAEAVGVKDAARALILAGERGQIGQRYVVSERFISLRDIFGTACDAVGVRPPQWGLPVRFLSALSQVSALVGAIANRDVRLTPLNVRLMHIMSPMDHSKAVRELGWQPASVHDAIAEAAHFFASHA
ncbi:NAD-dependent epimerase/dehydratase family protein [Mycolicibacterium setense]|uniref:NAD-dependent epimerase/dehydratase family protein n=1 Tax=Mycolicibacterium setense TaxID=431269 RepID=UPI000574FBDE|nr:NAD-dependent epimerase/dehydratase family protein [Mycolicibacterium setense]KHO24962.1 NAD-dependent dehydratase [Mycolicibacterium setense]MCV7109768.1 NAD-dependent epimerase/dehydratase family protein [Mycolicibacterium setense]